MKKYLIFYIIFGSSLFSFNVHASEGESSARFNVRINPLIVFIGGNLDFDFILSPQWTVGPSYFGWGGCGNRTSELKTKEGNQCNTWSAYGVRGNYYLGETQNKLYVGTGVYQTKKSFSYGFSGQELKGDISGTSVTALVGYAMIRSSGFNVNVGVGGLYFLNKPSDVVVSKSGTQTTISSGYSTQFLAEASLGYMF